MKDDQIKYYKNIVSQFQFKGKKILLYELKKHINENQEDDLTYDKLIENFGTPNEVYNSYIESLDEVYLANKLNHKNGIKRLIIISVICVISLCMFLFYKINQEAEEAKKHRVDNIEYIIEEE